MNRREAMGDFGRGVLTAVAGHMLLPLVLFTMALILSPFIGPYGIFLVFGGLMFGGGLQLLYMVPLIWRGVRRGERHYVSGLCLGGVMFAAAIIIYFVVDELRRPLP